jgi:GTPase
MFIDIANVEVQAGDGGNGAVSFRHEKFVDRGGPDGGDGGKGGSIIFQASRNQNTLATFRYQKLLKATSGEPGTKRKRHGKNGDDLIVMVPVGTVVTNADGEVIADLVQDGAQMLAAKGGNGGFGNAHFVSSTRQAPRVAEKGEKGAFAKLVLELKMIADVGLVGLPNAGKSTLLSIISNAEPEIANYPFTTLTPNLGVVDVSKSESLLMADIPGLIEGASQGKGLGDEFLRHVERTAVLVHLIDIYNDDVISAYKTIQQELKDYEVDLSKKPQIVVLTKIEGLDDEIVQDKMLELKKVLPRGTKLFAISAMSKQGVDKLLFSVLEKVKKQRAKVAAKTKDVLPVITFQEPEDNWKVTKNKDHFVVAGKKIERFAQRTDFENPHGVRRLRDIMRKMGIMHELEKQKIDAGQTIVIGNNVGKITY